MACLSQLSAEGFVSQACYLNSRQIHVQTDLKIIACGRVEEVIRQVADGRAQAGFISQASWDDSLDRDLAVLAVTGPVPNWVCVSLDGGNYDVDAKLADAMLKLNPGNPEQRKILKALGVYRFAKPAAADMGEMAKMANQAGVPY